MGNHAGDLNIQCNDGIIFSESYAIHDWNLVDNASSDKTSRYSFINVNGGNGSVAFDTDHYNLTTRTTGYGFLKLLGSNNLNLEAQCNNYAGIGLADNNGANVILCARDGNNFYVYQKINNGNFSQLYKHSLSNNAWRKYKYSITGITLTISVYDSTDTLLFTSDVTINSVFTGDTVYPCVTSYWNTSAVAPVKNIIIK